MDTFINKLASRPNDSYKISIPLFDVCAGVGMYKLYEIYKGFWKEFDYKNTVSSFYLFRSHINVVIWSLKVAYACRWTTYISVKSTQRTSHTN